MPHFQSVPVVPVLNRSGKEYATFESIRRRPNVAQPTLHYANADDLVAKLDDAVVRRAEAMLSEAGEGPAAA